LPVALESLRALRDSAAIAEAVVISAADPLNLVGIILPGDRISSVSGKRIELRDGVASAEDAASTGFQSSVAV
jgi:ATP-dependent Lhr-like helicase